MWFGEREEEDVVVVVEGDGVGGVVLLFILFVFGVVDFVVVCDMVELIVVFDVGVRVVWNEGCGFFCCCFVVLLLLFEGDCGGGNGYLVWFVGFGEVGGEVMVVCVC